MNCLNVDNSVYSYRMISPCNFCCLMNQLDLNIAHHSNYKIHDVLITFSSHYWHIMANFYSSIMSYNDVIYQNLVELLKG